MNLTINNYQTNQKKYYKPTFKGPIDGALTGVLRTLDTNPTANAAVLDLGTMVAPRTYFDTKDRNKYAGGETFIRELSGTFVNCFSAGILGVMIANVAAKRIQPDVKINPKSWFSDDSIKVLKAAWDKCENNTSKYLENIFGNLSGFDGKHKAEFKNIDWDKIEWFDENKWNKYTWDNPEYKNIQENLKSKDGLIDTFTRVINDKNITKKDRKQVFEIFETRLTNALKVNREVEVNIDGKSLHATLSHVLRDTYDMAKDVFTNEKVNTEAVLSKIKKVNNAKIFGALSLASLIGISIQHFNRKLTEKRSGKKGFVGEVDYMTKAADNTEKTQKGLWVKKLLASAGMIGMVLAVMRVKNPKDFIKKLQFTGPVSTGNAIKTVYMSTIIGRFLAADSENELRESVVRDYFGFLNWLVLGGFAAKGVANILDPKMKSLFNIDKEGKGLKHWLNHTALKTHEEIAAHGKEFAKKNIWKLNLAHIAGLGYSTLMLGILLPKINTYMTTHKQAKAEIKK